MNQPAPKSTSTSSAPVPKVSPWKPWSARRRHRLAGASTRGLERVATDTVTCESRAGARWGAEPPSSPRPGRALLDYRGAVELDLLDLADGQGAEVGGERRVVE